MVKGCASTSADRKPWSLPPCRRAAKPRRPPSHAHVSARRAMGATRARCAGGLKAEDRVIACPKGPAIDHAPPPSNCRHAGSPTSSPIRWRWPGSMWRPRRDRVRARQPGAGVHRRQRRQGFTGAGLPAVRPPRQPRSCRSPPADPQRPGPVGGASRCRCAKTGGAARCRTRRRAQAGRRHDGPLAVAVGMPTWPGTRTWSA